MGRETRMGFLCLPSGPGPAYSEKWICEQPPPTQPLGGSQLPHMPLGLRGHRKAALCCFERERESGRWPLTPSYSQGPTNANSHHLTDGVNASSHGLEPTTA